MKFSFTDFAMVLPILNSPMMYNAVKMQQKFQTAAHKLPEKELKLLWKRW